MMLVITAAGAVILLGMLASTFVPSRGRAMAERFALQVGLALDEDRVPALGRRLLVRERLRESGGLVGVVLGGVLAWALESTGAIDPLGAGWLLAAGLFGGVAGGIAVAGLLPTALPEGSPRMARTRSVGLDDYISPIEQLGPRALAFAAGLLAILSLAAQVLGDGRGTGMWLTAVITGGLTVFFIVLGEAAGRLIIARGRPAPSEADLAWDDALRSTSYRDLMTAPLYLGTQAVLSGILTVAEALAPLEAQPYLASVTFGVVMTGFIVVIVVAARIDPARHYLRRLWPELAARREAALHGAGLYGADTPASAPAPAPAPERSAR